MSLGQLSELHEGMNLPEIRREVTQENINLYAEASKDFNPIHMNEEFARRTSLGGTVAHGMLILAYVSQMMTVAFGESWVVGGKLNVRFRAAARPGDNINVSGKISKIDIGNEQTIISCNVLCSRQTGEPVITGEARVIIKSSA